MLHSPHGSEYNAVNKSNFQEFAMTQAQYQDIRMHIFPLPFRKTKTSVQSAPDMIPPMGPTVMTRLTWRNGPHPHPMSTMGESWWIKSALTLAQSLPMRCFYKLIQLVSTNHCLHHTPDAWEHLDIILRRWAVTNQSQKTFWHANEIWNPQRFRYEGALCLTALAARRHICRYCAATSEKQLQELVLWSITWIQVKQTRAAQFRSETRYWWNDVKCLIASQAHKTHRSRLKTPSRQSTKEKTRALDLDSTCNFVD